MKLEKFIDSLMLEAVTCIEHIAQHKERELYLHSSLIDHTMWSIKELLYYKNHFDGSDYAYYKKQEAIKNLMNYNKQLFQLLT